MSLSGEMYTAFSALWWCVELEADGSEYTVGINNLHCLSINLVHYIS